MQYFYPLDQEYFPKNITVYRVDDVERVKRQGGFLTARTLLAHSKSANTNLSFAADDVIEHCLSTTHQSRLDQPS